MPTSIKYFWLPQDLQAVSLTQNVAVPGNLLLNGTYTNPATSTISFKDQGFVRQVSLTSVNDLSGATFTVSGVQNTTLVTNVLAGPNNNTVTTPDSFDIISSVSVDMAVTGIKVGTGLVGYFPLINRINSSIVLITSPSINYALGFSTEAVNGCTYQIYQSLTNLSENGETYLALIADSSFISVSGPYVNITQILQRADVCYNIVVGVTASANTSTLEMEFLQL